MRLLLLTLTLAFGLSGCSVVLARGAPADYRRLGEFECTQSHALTVIDGILAAGAIGAGVTAEDVEGDFSLGASKEFQTIGGIVMAVGFGLSAKAGYDRVQSCREAQAEVRRGLSAQLGVNSETNHPD